MASSEEPSMKHPSVASEKSKTPSSSENFIRRPCGDMAFLTSSIERSNAMA